MEEQVKKKTVVKASRKKRRRSHAKVKTEKNSHHSVEEVTSVMESDSAKSTEKTNSRKRRFTCSTDDSSERTVDTKRIKLDTEDKQTESATKEMKTGKRRKRKRKKKGKAATSQPQTGSQLPTISQPQTIHEEAQNKANGVTKKRGKRKGKRKQTEAEEEESEVDGPMMSKISHLDVLPRHKTKYEKSVELQSKMVAKLNAARFRYINEQLYTCTGSEALETIGKDKEAFKVYHQGYSSQVCKWPVNPVDKIISYIKKKSSTMVIADFGCGEAKIAQSVPNTVFSFDLVALNKYVVECDMAEVPLEDDSVDMVVFCLSLMGTNLIDFLTEANRILCTGGTLKIAEVASRFENVKKFVRALKRLGFTLQSKDLSNKYFFTFEFKKTGKAENWSSLYGLELKPCLYKKR
ncbi:ribosomal RNA-processing protein 8-like [Ptychodera flava]|uniref:ribosomal RNA-processing protein 8-like n=1 Tax=Ptychodera flava TaxID=63121 RepID=UPI00396A5D1A